MNQTTSQPTSSGQLSADGAHFWNGRQWESSISSDGAWRWDGTRWRRTQPSRLSLLLRVDRPATGAVLLAGLAVGVLADVAGRAQGIGMAATLMVMIAASVLLVLDRAGTWSGRVLLILVAVIAAGWSYLSSPWVVLTDLAVVAGLLLLSPAWVRGKRLCDLSFVQAGGRILLSMVHLAAAPSFAISPLRRLSRPASAQVVAVLRGLLIAVPVLGLIGALLAGADPVFASFFHLDLQGFLGHLLLIVAGSWTLLGLARAGSVAEAPPVARRRWRLGKIELGVLLVGIDVLYGAFDIAQMMAYTGGARAALVAANVTYSEYARSGFFQLLWAAGITLVLLLNVSVGGRDESGRRRWKLLVLVELAVVLALLTDIAAFNRLRLYEETYGFTMLRLYCQVFAVWLGVGYVLLGLRLGGIWPDREWFFGAQMAAGLILVVALNLVNPEALVVHWNLDRAIAGQRFDSDYQASLSDDAIGVLVDALPRLEGGKREEMRRQLCSRKESQATDWRTFNLARVEAQRRLRTICPLS